MIAGDRASGVGSWQVAGKAGTTGKNNRDNEAVAGEVPPSCWAAVAQDTRTRGLLWLVQAVMVLPSSLFILCVIRALLLSHQLSIKCVRGIRVRSIAVLASSRVTSALFGSYRYFLSGRQLLRPVVSFERLLTFLSHFPLRLYNHHAYRLGG